MTKSITITPEAQTIYARLEAYKAARDEAAARGARENSEVDKARDARDAARDRFDAEYIAENGRRGSRFATALFDDADYSAASEAMNAHYVAERTAMLETRAIDQAAAKLAMACAARVVVDNAALVDGKKSHYVAVEAVTDQINETFPLVRARFTTGTFSSQRLEARAEWQAYRDSIERDAAPYDSPTINIGDSRLEESAAADVPSIDDIRRAAASYRETAAAMADAVKACRARLEELSDSISALAYDDVQGAEKDAKRWF